MLSDLDASERDEVLAGIREHFDAVPSERPADPTAVEAVLLRLGSPEQVAAEARRGLAPVSGFPDAVPQPTRAAAAAPSFAVAALPRVAVATTLLVTVPFLLLIFWTRASAVMSAGGSGWPETVGLFGTNGMEVALLMVLTSPLWVVALVCALVAPTLHSSTRLRLALLGPASFVVAILAASWSAPGLLSGVIAGGLVVLTLWQAVIISRDAWHQAG
jgi:hypothetical protein